MPLYEYACTSCDHQFEVMQRFADGPLTVCEQCGGSLKKLLSAPAFQFKGSGWYATDYAKKKGDDPSSGSAEKDGAEKDGSEKKADGDTGDKKTDNKNADTKKKPTGSSNSAKADG